MSTTAIKNADWIIAWNEEKGRHEYLRDGDVVFSGNRIEFVGHGYTGLVDREISGRGRLADEVDERFQRQGPG